MASLYGRAKEVFLEASVRPAAERDALLAAGCGDDLLLRQEVESLLAVLDAESADPASLGPVSEPAAFTAGEIFAGRYRMVAQLGQGGMGDVWRADDLVLETPVALKLIHSSAGARARVLNEVRLARQITHPAVCRVFDVSETDGTAFYSMELVEGEDLAALIRRGGRLSSEKVIDIAHQLCAGLAAAHAQHVLHRDLKPANILVDNHGRVRIADFGIATASTHARPAAPIGTLAYMAPEQFDPQGELSERTDIYALGAVLYELLTGTCHVDAAGPGGPIPPSKLVPNADPQLERVILQALATEPVERPASAVAIATALPALSTPGQRQMSRWIVATVAALAILALGSYWMFARGPSALSAQDTILVADFQNTTNDPVFDGTLKVALALALEQSPFIRIFPDDRVPETLRLMSRAPDARLTRSVARELAQREQLKALIAGWIGNVGGHYVLGLEAVNVETGDVIARQQVEIESKERVLAALGYAASRLREQLGESLASIRKFDAALTRATTPSLEALRAYSLAVEGWRVNPGPQATPHLERALELDPNFALAYALLANVYAATGQTARAPEYARRAYELRDRVSERERFPIMFSYHRDATQAWDKAFEVAEAWTQTYPRDAFAFNHLGMAFQRFGQFEQAIEAYRHGLTLDPKLALLYANLASALLALDRYGEVDRVVHDADTHGAQSQGLRRVVYSLAFIRGDAETMARTLESSIGLGQTNFAYEWQAHASAFSGRVNTAHEQFQLGTRLAAQVGLNDIAGQLAAQDAVAHALVGLCEVTRQGASAALNWSRDNVTLELLGRALGLCGDAGRATSLLKELESQYPQATLTVRIAAPIAAAAIALRRGQPQRAIDLLEPVRPYDHTAKAIFWPAYLRGLAYLDAKLPAKAGLEFQSILDHRGEYAFSGIYPLAHLGAARAAAMTGDTDRARTSYERFITLWREADSGLQPMNDAREELAGLKDTSR